MIKILFAVLFLLLANYVGYKYYENQNIEVPNIPEPDWGPSHRMKDTTIKPFEINIPQNVIDDLKQRLSRTRYSVPPLENTGWTYGVSSKYLREIVNYWKDKYNWNERQELLNKYSQFVTNIQGLNIHFYHVKPNKVQNDKGKKLKVLPLLLLHGWPGSVVEFQKIIPLLTTPQPDKDFVFEIVVPSLPGYGFSEGAVRPGLGHIQMAVIFKNLMERLGFHKFYTQAGDWGSVISTDIAILYPDRVYGTHLNMCSIRITKPSFWLLIGSLFPSLVVEPKYASRIYPLKYHYGRLLEETGYFHIQATKPDTLGAALTDSPVGLAAWILEKFSTATDETFRFQDDGGLLEKFTMDELLDNVMLYWVTNSITTSVRLYSESYTSENFGKLDSFPVKTLLGCAVFPHEIAYIPESIVKTYFKNLVQYDHLPQGGHFAAFEEPKILSDNVWSFAEKVERKNILDVDR